MVEKLFEAISERKQKLVEIMDLFGSNYWYVKNELHALEGMETSFEIIAGHSYTSHLIAKIDENLNKASEMLHAM